MAGPFHRDLLAEILHGVVGHRRRDQGRLDRAWERPRWHGCLSAKHLRQAASEVLDRALGGRVRQQHRVRHVRIDGCGVDDCTAVHCGTFRTSARRRSDGFHDGSMSICWKLCLDANPKTVRHRRETVEHPFGTKARMGATPPHRNASKSSRRDGSFGPCL
jgi:hypothetical protein